MAVRDISMPYKPGDVTESEIISELCDMELDPELDTRVSLEKEDATALRLITFQEKHLAIIMKNPKINPLGYLANLRTMIKIRK